MLALPDGVEARDAIRPAHRAPLQVLVQDPPFCVAIGWRLAASRVAADPGYLRGVGIAAETGAAQGRQLGRLDRPGPGRRAGNCGHLAQPRSRRRLAGPWSVRLPYLRSSRHGCGHRRFGGQRYKPRSVLVLLRDGCSGARRHDLTRWDPRPAATAAPETGFITGEQPVRATGTIV